MQLCAVVAAAAVAAGIVDVLVLVPRRRFMLPAAASRCCSCSSKLFPKAHANSRPREATLEFLFLAVIICDATGMRLARAFLPD